MANKINKGRIRILRTNDKSKISEPSNKVLADGQPLYDKNTKYLYVGDGSTPLSTIEAVRVAKATGDESGNNIKATYGNSLGTSGNKIVLKNKNGSELNSITVPYASKSTNSDLAAQAVKLQTGRTITVSGNGTNNTATFDGTGNVSLTIGKATNAGTADVANRANVTRTDTDGNAEVKFNIGGGTPYSKTINNVSHASNADYIIQTYSEIDNEADYTVALAPNKYVKLKNAVTRLQMNLGNSDYLTEYVVEFTIVSSSANIVLPSGYKFINDWTASDIDSTNYNYIIYMLGTYSSTDSSKRKGIANLCWYPKG